MTTEDDQQPDQTATDGPPRQFQLRKIYTKDISFESPNAPGIFSKPVNPAIDLNLAANSREVGAHEYEVTITLRISARHEEDTIFLIEMEQAGIFFIENVKEGRLAYLLAVNCPEILFPYARQVISDMVVSGGYPPLLLAPFNFAALYRRHLQQAQQQQTTH